MENKYLTSSLRIIFIVSIIYAILAGSGFYGFSNDFYAEYFRSNLIYPSFREVLGSLLSTITIFDIHLGVELTSFFVAISSGLLIRSIFIVNNKNSLPFFLFIFLIMIHTHPIIMSTSGAMRQGWVMSFVYIGLSIIISDNKRLLPTLLFFMAVFFHKSGLIFFLLYLLTQLFFMINKIIEIKRFYLIIFGILLFSTSCIVLDFLGWTNANHRIVYGDFRFFWLIINFVYVVTFLYIINKNYLKELKFPSFFLYFHACIATSFLLMGLNWQYERINMIIGILVLTIFISFFKKKYFYLYLTIGMCTYLLLTIIQGMYSIGLT
ncbi:EpsG family protein [Candidatus Pelagibacter sp.]|nr:EpsG family protein [Candidatus Pelagibacter sp.]